MTDPKLIRNICTAAHIDHGKSTLADRMLELTGVLVGDHDAQYLDRMDLERERGITIKAAAVRMEYKAADGEAYTFNLIDTPGHVDFSYEVSRALEACEGALLLVDATQGVEAQTIANLYLAIEAGLDIIPVINKVDLAGAEPDRVEEEIYHLLGGVEEGVMRISAKTGEGVPELLEEIVRRVSPPKVDLEDRHLRSLIFDSMYDPYRGVITYVRVMSGEVYDRAEIQLMSTGHVTDITELGVLAPGPTPVDRLGPGEVGYIVTGIKDVRQARVGDTITLGGAPAPDAVPGFREPRSMVWTGLYPEEGQYEELRDALDKLRLNDAGFVYEPETSHALGFGFRCGFLGLLHMEIITERLFREFNLDLVVTAPTVAYHVVLTDGTEEYIHSPADLADPSRIERIEEPFVRAMVITPADHVGAAMELCQSKRGEQEQMDYLSPERVELVYALPLGEIIFDFFDQLKSRTRGYASLDYEPSGYRAADLVRVDLLVHGQPVDAFSSIVHRDRAYAWGRAMTHRLRELIPRQMFDIAIQAAVGSKIIARETVKAKRKDVLSKCYGGDVTRKRKLLEKQKKGKAKMKMLGQVEVPPDVFIQALRVEESK